MHKEKAPLCKGRLFPISVPMYLVKFLFIIQVYRKFRPCLTNAWD